MFKCIRFYNKKAYLEYFGKIKFIEHNWVICVDFKVVGKTRYLDDTCYICCLAPKRLVWKMSVIGPLPRPQNVIKLRYETVIWYRGSQ